MKICIAVLTTGVRSNSLSECLLKIADLYIPDNGQVQLLVVQNGQSKPNYDFMSDEELEHLNRNKIAVVAVPTKGIPFGRNGGIEYALRHGFDFLAFIDDDAFPARDWLVKLMQCLSTSGAEAATGPQVPIFPDSTPSHLRNAGIYRERRLPHASLCKWAATNNVVFNVNYAAKKSLRFNEKFATGGSDKEFFLRFSKHGGKIIWCSDAIVYEEVTSERLSVDWATKRAYRYGVTGYKIEVATRKPTAATLVCAVKGSAYLASGGAKAVSALFLGKQAWVDAMCQIAHGLGFWLGLFSFFRLRRYV